MKYIRWVSVEERRPDDLLAAYKRRFTGEWEIGVIVMIKDAALPNHLYYDGESFRAETGEEYEVTHWMELPPTPAECAIDIDLGDNIQTCYEELLTLYN